EVEEALNEPANEDCATIDDRALAPILKNPTASQALRGVISVIVATSQKKDKVVEILKEIEEKIVDHLQQGGDGGVPFNLEKRDWVDGLNQRIMGMFSGAQKSLQDARYVWDQIIDYISCEVQINIAKSQQPSVSENTTACRQSLDWNVLQPIVVSPVRGRILGGIIGGLTASVKTRDQMVAIHDAMKERLAQFVRSKQEMIRNAKSWLDGWYRKMVETLAKTQSAIHDAEYVTNQLVLHVRCELETKFAKEEGEDVSAIESCNQIDHSVMDPITKDPVKGRVLTIIVNGLIGAVKTKDQIADVTERMREQLQKAWDYIRSDKPAETVKVIGEWINDTKDKLVAVVIGARDATVSAHHTAEEVVDYVQCELERKLQNQTVEAEPASCQNVDMTIVTPILEDAVKGRVLRGVVTSLAATVKTRDQVVAVLKDLKERLLRFVDAKTPAHVKQGISEWIAKQKERLMQLVAQTQQAVGDSRHAVEEITKYIQCEVVKRVAPKDDNDVCDDIDQDAVNAVLEDPIRRRVVEGIIAGLSSVAKTKNDVVAGVQKLKEQLLSFVEDRVDDVKDAWEWIGKKKDELVGIVKGAVEEAVGAVDDAKYVSEQVSQYISCELSKKLSEDATATPTGCETLDMAVLKPILDDENKARVLQGVISTLAVSVKTKDQVIRVSTQIKDNLVKFTKASVEGVKDAWEWLGEKKDQLVDLVKDTVDAVSDAKHVSEQVSQYISCEISKKLSSDAQATPSACENLDMTVLQPILDDEKKARVLHGVVATLAASVKTKDEIVRVSIQIKDNLVKFSQAAVEGAKDAWEKLKEVVKDTKEAAYLADQVSKYISCELHKQFSTSPEETAATEPTCQKLDMTVLQPVLDDPEKSAVIRNVITALAKSIKTKDEIVRVSIQIKDNLVKFAKASAETAKDVWEWLGDRREELVNLVKEVKKRAVKTQHVTSQIVGYIHCELGKKLIAQGVESEVAGVDKEALVAICDKLDLEVLTPILEAPGRKAVLDGVVVSLELSVKGAKQLIEAMKELQKKLEEAAEDWEKEE
ncbi:hypothetical protein HK102_006564, partial [Quaeritorhiza haematococci]